MITHYDNIYDDNCNNVHMNHIIRIIEINNAA